LEIQHRSEEDKHKIIMEIKHKNHEIEVSDQANEFLSMQSELGVDVLDDNRQLLRSWLLKHSTRQRYASTFLDEILKQVHHEETFEIDLNQSEKLLVQYRKLRIIKKSEDFKVVLDSIEYRDYGTFEIREKGEQREGIELLPDDFPLTIRNLQSKDAIKLSFGTKNIFRWCVDRKIPMDQRRKILVIVNKSDEIIFASGIGANVTHTCALPRVFVVK
jgi:tRNA(Ile)-lysidine synthase